jgi:CMP-N,N'-diacetyllegionaminic acid synthase
LNVLYIIPARAGSKGIPHKNSKELAGKSLIQYTLDLARAVTADENICVTTDDEQIIAAIEKTGLTVPFKRPDHLASDQAGTYDVLLHALSHYEESGRSFDAILLLQPTSPFRKIGDVHNMLHQYDPDLDMVVSVGETHHNPYYLLFEENEEGYLQKSKTANFTRRQDCPKVYFYNGSMYLINVKSLKQKPIGQFTRVKKYLMDEIHSVDIDTPLDWLLCEAILKEGYYTGIR